jgi:hypothetical protein
MIKLLTLFACSVEEVSSAVMFLLSPGASYITGVNLDVGGGSHLVTNARYTEEAGVKYDPWPLPKL